MDDLTLLYSGVRVVDYSKPILDFVRHFDGFHDRVLTRDLNAAPLKLATIEYSLVMLKRPGYSTTRVKGFFEACGYEVPYLMDLLHVCTAKEKVFWGLLADRKLLVALTKPVLLHFYNPHVPVLSYQLMDASTGYQKLVGLWPSLFEWTDQAFLVINNRRYSI